MALHDGGRDCPVLRTTDGPFKTGHVWSPEGLRIGTVGLYLFERPVVHCG